MTAEQIESAYEETVKKVLAVLEDDRRKNEEIDREVERLKDQRELERKLFWKMKGEFERKTRRKGDDGDGNGNGEGDWDRAVVKEERET